MWSSARSALQEYFGFSEFRPGQADVIRAVLAGRDVLVIMPTGGGKSLCYQVPALVLPGLTLVVSPLIALMQDQVAALERTGVPAAAVNSTLTPSEVEERLRAAVAGELRLLYLAPERFGTRGFQRTIDRLDVRLVAIDEAHCVSEWGHDFRPSYLRLREFWPRLGRPPVLALTATATPEVRRDIIGDLGLRRPRTIVRGFDRANLFWGVRRVEKLDEKCRALVDALEAAPGSSLVYASTRKMVEAATELLRAAGVPAAAYHAGLSQARRARGQEAWMEGEIPVVVATNAFGLGIDKPDVRRVIHFQMPGSLEAYYQEAGRAGRDGEPAECWLLHSYRDRFTHEYFVRMAYPERETVELIYREIDRLTAANGGPVKAARIVRRLGGRASDREVHATLRILSDARCIRSPGRSGGWRIRWIAGADRLDELDEAGGNGLPEPAVTGLRRLLNVSARGHQRSLRLGRREVARWFGGDIGVARSALDALQEAGLLGWREEGRASGYVTGPRDPVGDALPVVWERLERRRDFELRKLRRMERYAYIKGCRRRYLLRYFGEESGRGSCGGCDRCD